MLHWSTELQRLDDDIAERQRRKRPGAGVAFLTLKSIRSAQILWQSIVHAGDFDEDAPVTGVPWPWVTEAPPPPESMRYDAMHVTGRQRFGRLLVINVANAAAVVLFYVPVAVLVGLAQTNTGLSSVPILGELVTLVPAAEGLVRGFLPSVGIALCAFVMLHWVLSPLVAAAGFLDFPTAHKSILSRFFVYQVLVTLLGATVGGSLIVVLQSAVTSPIGAINVIAQSIPQQAVFFIAYTMLFALVKPALSLLMLPQLLLRWLKRTLWSVSYRDLRESDGPWAFSARATA